MDFNNSGILKEPQSLEEWGNFYLNVPTVPWVDEDLVKRVREYNKLLPLHRDIRLKFQKKNRFIPRIYIQRAQFMIPALISAFIKSKDKKSALQRHMKRLILKST